MEAPPNLKPATKNPREETYKKATENNENYSLNLKIAEKDSIYISITFDGDSKLYEDIKSYEDIKKKQAYFEDCSLEEIYDKLLDLISKNNFELKRNHEQILFNIVLPFKKKKTLDFVLEIKKAENDIINNALFQQIIKEKNEIIKKQDEIIKQKDEIIKEKNNIIKSLEEIIKKNSYADDTKVEKTNNLEKKEDKAQTSKNNKDYNEIFKDFNIINHTPKYKLTNHGEKIIYTILQLQDGRLASGGYDGSIIIYNKQTFVPELTIKKHKDSICNIIQLKNGNLLSCSYYDKTMNEYKLNENNTYQVLSTVNVGQDNNPRQIVELENNEIGLVAYNHMIFYLNINNKLDEDFKIKSDNNQIGAFYEMLSVKPGELVISGDKHKIQFFELNTRKLKEIININRIIHYNPSYLLCMMNERCLCVGGENKITIIDVYNKNIISEVEENGIHRCLYKLNDNILLTGKNNGDITQWRINGNNLTFVNKKEKAHQNYINEIIRFNNSIISCSDDHSIKIW